MRVSRYRSAVFSAHIARPSRMTRTLAYALREVREMKVTVGSIARMGRGGCASDVDGSARGESAGDG